MTEQEIRVELERWRGLSAYEVAVKNGFDGTETEWLEALMGGTIQITVNGKAIGTDGNIAVYAGDIKMDAGSLNTVASKMKTMETSMGDFVKKSGDTMEGNLTISKSYRPALNLTADAKMRTKIFANDDAGYRLTIDSYADDQTDNVERYMFPVADTGLTATKDYHVLTTKNPVTIAQGGTGATTAAGIRNAIGLGNTTGPVPIANGGTGNTTGNAASATKLATARTVRTNLGSTETASFDGTANITPGVTGTLPIANGGTGNTKGLAASATKLATARTVRTNLGSTETASFDGTANITPGVTGTLPIANGGTGATTAKGAEFAINGSMSSATSSMTDDSTIVCKRTTPSASDGVFVYRPITQLWTYIAGKIRSVFGFTSANVLPVANGGTGATTAAAARTALGAVAMATTTVTLTADGWSDQGYQVVTATGVTSSNTVITAPANASYGDYYNHSVRCVGQQSGKLTFRCSYNNVPTADITANVLILT